MSKLEKEYSKILKSLYSPDLVNEILYGEKVAKSLYHSKIKIETSGNIIIKYIETNKDIVILGMISKQGKATRDDVVDLRSWINTLEAKIAGGKTLYTDTNIYSERIISNILKRNPGFKVCEPMKYKFAEGEWSRVIIQNGKEEEYEENR
jgi:hypothetical protein